MTENAIVWSYANAWEPIARMQPDQPAALQGDRVLSWGAFDAEADALAARLIEAGLQHNSKVGIYLHNCAEYLTANYAAFKAGLAPFNVNYRYTADELLYLFDNADAEAIVFHAGFAERVDEIRARLPQVKCWIAVEEPGFSAPPWAENYERVVANIPANRPTLAPWGRSNDDLLILYTGGTTGLPKGVMWRQEDQIGVTGAGGSPLLGIPPLSRPEEAVERVPLMPRRIALVACPLMHGTGLFSALMTLLAGGAVALLPSRHFDATQLWNEVAHHRVTSLAIVGLPFAQPMLEALERNPGRWDLSCVTSIGSSGAMWSTLFYVFCRKPCSPMHFPQAKRWAWACPSQPLPAKAKPRLSWPASSARSLPRTTSACSQVLASAVWSLSAAISRSAIMATKKKPSARSQ